MFLYTYIYIYIYISRLIRRGDGGRACGRLQHAHRPLLLGAGRQPSSPFDIETLTDIRQSTQYTNTHNCNSNRKARRPFSGSRPLPSAAPQAQSAPAE